MQRALIILALTLSLDFVGQAAYASTTLRCGSSLVSTGSTTNEVLQKCGEPATRDMLGTILTTGSYGERYERQVEEWSYAPRNGMYQFLRFEGGRLVRVDSKRKQ